jgi:hypothetical protein
MGSSSSELQASALSHGDLSYNLTTKKKKKPTTHGLTAHSLLGHLSAFLKNHTPTHPSAGKNPNTGKRRGQGR